MLPNQTPINNLQLNNIRNTINVLKNANNPVALMQNAFMQNNPQIKQAVDYVQAHGGNPKDAFYALAQERGIDPNTITSMM